MVTEAATIIGSMDPKYIEPNLWADDYVIYGLVSEEWVHGKAETLFRAKSFRRKKYSLVMRRKYTIGVVCFKN